MLTLRQQAVYDFIVEFRRQEGCSPSIPEIQRAFAIRSPNGVAGHLRALEAKGFIHRANRGSRQIELSGHSTVAAVADIPIYGDIPAGLPQDMPPAAAGDCIRLDEETLGFRPSRSCFALRVRGDSMIEAGILPGDLAIIQPTPNPRAGQIVAALIDGESTLKRLVRLDGKWFLKAENKAYRALHPRATLTVQGVLRTLVRKF